MDEGKITEDEMSASAATVTAPPGNLEQVFAEHHGRVYRAAYRITGNAGDAEDILQTVFLRLVRQGWTPEVAVRIESYLYRTAVNAALDLVRSRQGVESVPLDDTVCAEDRNERPGASLDAAELRDQLRKAVARLAPKAAEIFALRYFEDCDNQEIARLLGLTPSDVAVSLHRSRNRIAEEIRPYWRSQGD